MCSVMHAGGNIPCRFSYLISAGKPLTLRATIDEDDTDLWLDNRCSAFVIGQALKWPER
jgi:hypothetical protein